MSRILDMLQKQEAGYHPLTAIHTIALNSDDNRLKLDCHKVIAKYVESERRSIDIKTEDGAELISLNICISGEDD